MTDREQAVREPQLAVLSLVAHGGGEVATAVAIARAAVDAVSSLPEEQRLLYRLDRESPERSRAKGPGHGSPDREVLQRRAPQVLRPRQSRGQRTSRVAAVPPRPWREREPTVLVRAGRCYERKTGSFKGSTGDRYRTGSDEPAPDLVRADLRAAPGQPGATLARPTASAAARAPAASVTLNDDLFPARRMRRAPR